MEGYILNLAHGKYYVGISQNARARFEQHKSHQGALWTKMHTPVGFFIPPKSLESIQDAKKWERVSTLKMMALYGADNVRGGAWAQRVRKDPPVMLTNMVTQPSVQFRCKKPVSQSEIDSIIKNGILNSEGFDSDILDTIKDMITSPGKIQASINLHDRASNLSAHKVKLNLVLEELLKK